MSVLISASRSVVLRHLKFNQEEECRNSVSNEVSLTHFVSLFSRFPMCPYFFEAFIKKRYHVVVIKSLYQKLKLVIKTLTPYLHVCIQTGTHNCNLRVNQALCFVYGQYFHIWIMFYKDIVVGYSAFVCPSL